MSLADRSFQCLALASLSLLLALGLHVAEAGAAEGDQASQSAEALTLRIDELLSDLPEAKLTRNFRQRLEDFRAPVIPYPEAVRTADVPEGEILGEQLLDVSVRVNAIPGRPFQDALEQVVSLPELEDARIIDQLSVVMGYVRADDLEALSAHPLVRLIDLQPRAYFQRSGSRAPFTMVPNRVAEIRRILKERRDIEPDGEGLRIGVISDGLAGSMWFRQQPNGLPIEDFLLVCDDPQSTATVDRINPTIPIGYQNVLSGDLPQRTFIPLPPPEPPVTQEITPPPDGPGAAGLLGSIGRGASPRGEGEEPTFDYFEVVQFNGKDFIVCAENGVAFMSFNRGFTLSGTAFPFQLAQDNFGAAECPNQNDEFSPFATGFPTFTERRFLPFLENLVPNSLGGSEQINRAVMRILVNPSGLLANEGTAMIDIVRDYVPNADFLFCNATTLTDYLDAFTYLGEAGCDIILTDAVFFHTGAYDGGNTVALLYNFFIQSTVGDDQLMVVSAAGNFAQNHHLSFALDPDNDGLHQFTLTDETLRIRIGAGETATVLLSWDERPAGNPNFQAAQFDVNLYLLDPLRPTLDNAVAVSDIEQQGLPGDLPFEAVSIRNAAPLARDLDIAIQFPVGTPGAIPLSLFAIGENQTSGVNMVEYRSPNGSIPNGPDSFFAYTIGELRRSDRFEVTPTSGRGPVPPQGGFIKPDVVTFSEVDNSTDNLFVAASNANFPEGMSVNGVELALSVLFPPSNSPLTGTSGAAAEAAGMVAMIASYLQKAGIERPAEFPGRTEWVRELLRAGARDLETPGLDNITGAGRLDPYRTIIPTIRAEGERFFYVDFNTLDEKQLFQPTTVEELGFTPPLFGDLNAAEPSALKLTSTNNTTTWGFFFSDTIRFDRVTGGEVVDDGTTLDPTKVYRIRARIAEEFNLDPSPIIRIRAQARNSNVVFLHTLNDNGFPDFSDQFQFDELGGTVYTHYFRPSESTAASGLEINIDIVNVNPTLAEQQTLLIQELEIVELDEI